MWRKLCQPQNGDSSDEKNGFFVVNLNKLWLSIAFFCIAQVYFCAQFLHRQ